MIYARPPAAAISPLVAALILACVTVVVVATPAAGTPGTGPTNAYDEQVHWYDISSNSAWHVARVVSRLSALTASTPTGDTGYYDSPRYPYATNAIGALDDASSAAFRAADNVTDFRVPLKHQPGAAGNWSRFGQGVDQQAAIREALTSDAATFRPNY